MIEVGLIHTSEEFMAALKKAGNLNWLELR